MAGNIWEDLGLDMPDGSPDGMLQLKIKFLLKAIKEFNDGVGKHDLHEGHKQAQKRLKEITGFIDGKYFTIRDDYELPLEAMQNIINSKKRLEKQIDKKNPDGSDKIFDAERILDEPLIRLYHYLNYLKVPPKEQAKLVTKIYQEAEYKSFENIGDEIDGIYYDEDEMIRQVEKSRRNLLKRYNLYELK